MSVLPEGRGNLHGHEAEVFRGEYHEVVLIESFYLWSQPHLSGFAELQYSKRTPSPRGTRRKEGFITQCRLEKNTSSSVRCMLFSGGKPGGGRGGYEGITKITKKTLRPSWELQGRLKKIFKKRKTLMQICRLRDLIQLCLENKRGGRRTYREWT